MKFELRKLFKATNSDVSAKQNNSFIIFIIISGLAILFFAVLSFMFPYTGDDWAWGSSIGISRLESFFENYNGRYLGNFVILALSRSKVLKVIVMALSYYITCWLCYKYTPLKRNAALLFSIVLFLIMPRDIFMQSVVWAAGFSNYVPSALISVAYILLIRNITCDDQPHYPKYLFVFTFIMGFCGAPFMENIAIFNICLGIAVIAYVIIKFKKVFAAHISFLIGAIAGALWMFSNTAYSSISSGADAYRTTPKGLKELVAQCLKNGYVICDYLVIANYMICIAASILLLLLTVRFIRNSKDKAKNISAISVMTVNAICLFLIICKNSQVLSSTIDTSFKFLLSGKFRIVLTVIYAASILALILICVQNGRRFRMLLPLYCVPVSVAPLLIVTPIGPRCFYISYLLTMVFVVDLFSYIISDIDIKRVDYKSILYSFGIVAVMQAFVYVSIFFPIYKYDTKRNEFAKLQSDNNESEVVVCNLPNEQYLWTSSPATEPWGTRYKLFYGLKDDVTLKVVNPDEFDEYYEGYRKD